MANSALSAGTILGDLAQVPFLSVSPSVDTADLLLSNTLDINADGGNWVLKCRVVNPLASGEDSHRLFINNLVTPGDYRALQIREDKTSEFGRAVISEPRIGTAHRSDPNLYVVNISLVDGFFLYTSYGICVNSGITEPAMERLVGYKIASVANITELRVKDAGGGNSIGANSIFDLYIG